MGRQHHRNALILSHHGPRARLPPLAPHLYALHVLDTLRELHQELQALSPNHAHVYAYLDTTCVVAPTTLMTAAAHRFQLNHLTLNDSKAKLETMGAPHPTWQRKYDPAMRILGVTHTPQAWTKFPVF